MRHVFVSLEIRDSRLAIRDSRLEKRDSRLEKRDSRLARHVSSSSGQFNAGFSSEVSEVLCNDYSTLEQHETALSYGHTLV